MDESDGSIDSFSPWITVCLNCDWDHVDQYSDRSSFAETLRKLFSRTKDTIIHSDAKPLPEIIEGIDGKSIHSFASPKDPARFLEANNNAVLQTGYVLGLDFTGINFGRFPGMEKAKHSV